LRSVREWDETDIDFFIKNQIKEDLNLDYKRSKSLEDNEHNKEEISKDVSAFANSDGGTIIYGIREEDHLPKEIDGGIEAEGKREWLEQVINSRIRPRIPNVIINQIDLKSIQEKAIFAVEIPVGTTAHQASDYRYYKRFNFQSIPMYDYEVKMTINRFIEPKIELQIDLSENLAGQNCLEIFAKNVGAISAPSAHFKLLIPEYLYDIKQGDGWYLGKETIEYKGVYVVCLMYNWGGPNKMEFFPGLMMPLSSKSLSDTVCIKVIRPPIPEPFVEVPIFYEIYATNMKPRKGRFLFKIYRTGRISKVVDQETS